MGDHYCCSKCHLRYDDCKCDEVKASVIPTPRRFQMPAINPPKQEPTPEMEDVEYFFNKFVKREDQKAADQLIEAVKLFMKAKS